jgi:hypothetical protein
MKQACLRCNVKRNSLSIPSIFNLEIRRLIFLIIVMLSLGFETINGQNPSDSLGSHSPRPEKKMNNFVWGGYLAIQVGSITLISVSPQVGYYFTPRVLLGMGISYEYYSEKWYDDRIKSSIYGGRLYNEYDVYTNVNSKPTKRQQTNFSIFTHLEYEAINLDRDFSNPDLSQTKNRFWIHGLLVGAGFKQHFGRRSSFNVVFLYNVINNDKSPFDNPQIRLGFYF